VAITPSQAGPRWPGWDDVIKTRSQMCNERAGGEAFVRYMNDLIKPRKWAPTAARDIAVRLRGAEYPDAFPLADIITVLNGCPGSRIQPGHTGTAITENQLGRWMRDVNCTVWVPTHHLDGTWSAPASAPRNVPAITISKSLALVRNAAAFLEGLDPTEVALCLDDAVMIKQLRAFRDDVMNRLSLVNEFLKEDS
jgi:hypothetical protein